MSQEHFAEPKLRKRKQNDGKLKEPAERAPNGQSRNNLRNKLALAYNPKYKINTDMNKLLTKSINGRRDNTPMQKDSK